MAIEYVGGQTASITVASPTTQTITYSLTGGLASAPAAGDLVIVGYGEGAGGDAGLSARISTSGFSLITELYANDSTDSNLAVFRKFMAGTPDSTLVVVGSSTSNAAATVNIQVWRGVDTTTPLDPTTTTATGTNTGNVNPAAITPAATGNVIAVFGHAATATANTSTFTAPSYLTNFLQVTRAGGIYRGVGGSGYVTGQPDGVSYDPAQWSISSDSTAYSYTAATLALRPTTIISIALTPNGITTTAPSVGASTLVQTYTTSPNGITAGQPTVGSPNPTQGHYLIPVDTTTGFPVLGSTTLVVSGVIFVNGITTGYPTVGSSFIAQDHVLTPVAITTGSPTVGESNLSIASAILAQGITTGQPVVDSSSVTTVNNLTPVAITTGSPTVDPSTIIQPQNLSTSPITTGNPEVGNTTIVSFQVLFANDSTTGNPTFGNVYVNGSTQRVVPVSAVSSNSVVVEEVYNTTSVVGSSNRATLNLENRAA
jgi:hypothetical protein